MSHCLRSAKSSIEGTVNALEVGFANVFSNEENPRTISRVRSSQYISVIIEGVDIRERVGTSAEAIFMPSRNEVVDNGRQQHVSHSEHLLQHCHHFCYHLSVSAQRSVAIGEGGEDVGEQTSFLSICVEIEKLKALV